MKVAVLVACAALILGLAIRWYTGAAIIGLTMLVVLVVWPMVGVLITIDDDLPGGFSNPDGSTPAPWTCWENWADLASRGALSGFGFALDAGWRTEEAVIHWLVGALGLIAKAVLHKHVQRRQQA